MMSALETRRKADFAKIRELCERSNGRVQLLRANGDAPSEISLRLNYRTASDSSYPNRFIEFVDLMIRIPGGYPFRAPPEAFLLPAVFHPNVYSNGQVCLGSKWIVSEYLDLLVRRVIRIITFQVDVLNESSPANGAAVSWYRNQRGRFPHAFPTDTAETVAERRADTGMKWSDLS